jgi:hypothetical protein
MRNPIRFAQGRKIRANKTNQFDLKICHFGEVTVFVFMHNSQAGWQYLKLLRGNIDK